VTNKPDHRGEREISRKTIAQGRPGVPANLWLLPLCFFVAQGAAGAPSARLSLRPHFSEGQISCKARAHRVAGMRSHILTSLRANGSRECAPDAKQSTLFFLCSMKWIASLRSQ
jgi:hypothetical protein